MTMGCKDMPIVPLPSLGGGLSIAVPLPEVNLDASLCCKILAIAVAPPPAAFGVALPPGSMNVIAAQIKLVQAYLDALPPKCPKE
jgi:hypothetical protein